MDERDSPADNPPPKIEGPRRILATWVFSPFIANSENEVKKYPIGRPGQEDKTGYTFLNIHPQNFVLGAGWGIISGYTSQAFFKPVPDKLNGMRLVSKQLAKRNILYPSLVAGRIVTRALLAGILYDVVERKTAQRFNSGIPSNSSTFVGLFVLSVFFKVANNVRESAIASAGILGGYIFGTTLARILHQSKKKRRASGGDDDR